ncbi:unnamed protein product [Lathyrus oleraceus]|uniref:Glycine-rich protein n=1 Tax=Pisum sativum TaxID=3888 RepID=A0A9D4XWX2_PEA|nr:glycine-rich protein 5-like [Pisum sativum]KAI5426151.1 hypothetical protein KIW84_031832 [Pisum sativum]
MAKWCMFLLVLALVVVAAASARDVPSDAGLKDQKNFMTFGGGFYGLGNNGMPFGGIGGGIGSGGLGGGGGAGGFGGLGGLGGGVGTDIGGGVGSGVGGGSGVLPFP